MTKFQLFMAMATNGDAKLTIKGVTGIVVSVEREDGSGSSFNVTMHVRNKSGRSEQQRFYVKTID